MIDNANNVNGLDGRNAATNQIPETLASDTVNLLDYLEVLVNNRWMIVKFTLIAALLSILLSFCLPEIYKATARILPPPQELDLMGTMLGGAGAIKGLSVGGMAADLLGKGTQADTYVGILICEAVADKIIDRFKLMEVYHLKHREAVYNVLKKNITIAAGKKDGIISITVLDKDSIRSAAIANAYVEELAKLLGRLNTSGAYQNKLFLQDRLSKAKSDLVTAENAFKAYRAKNKIFSVNEQAQTAIGGIAQVRAQLIAQQVQLAISRQYFSEESQEVKSLKTAVANLEAQVARLEKGGSGGAIPGFETLSELGQQYLRLLRDFKMQETLVEVLSRQYEMATYNEAKNFSVVQVIQTARVPDYKFKPKRKMIALVSTFSAFSMAVLYAFFRESGKRITDEDRRRLHAIRCILLREKQFD